MSNATFSRKPLVAAVLTTLAVFSAGAMAGETEEAKTNVELTIGTAESTTDKTVAGTVQNEQTWDEAWAKKFDDKFTNASGTVTIGEGTDEPQDDHDRQGHGRQDCWQAHQQPFQPDAQRWP